MNRLQISSVNPKTVLHAGLAGLLVLAPLWTFANQSSAKLGQTQAVHALTRGHSRKVVWEPVHKRFYAFWLEESDGTPVVQPGEGIVSQRSKNGKSWSKARAIGFDEAGSSSFDIATEGGTIYALGLATNVTTGFAEYGIRELQIAKNGSLIPGAFNPAWVNNANPSENHFYGSMLKDSAGYFWIAARVGDSTPGTHQEVIRSTLPDRTDGWGPAGCLGDECAGDWVDPFAGLTLEQGTIAGRLLDLGGSGVGLMTYNKNAGTTATIGQIVWTRNASGGHAGWAAPLVLTTNANQVEGPSPLDPTRLDDRRFAAAIDPATGVIHVAYIGRDETDSTSGMLHWFSLSPPYTSLADMSADQVIVPAETDGVQIAIDATRSPSRIYLVYIQNRDPDYEARMIWNDGAGWILPAGSLSVSGSHGHRHYPQMPVRVEATRIPVLVEEDLGSALWEIRARSVKLPR